MTTPQEQDIEPLLAHAAWIKQLARGLVTDPHRADDLVQDTWVTALRSSWERRGTPRAYLAGILHRRALAERRGRLRREDYEARIEPREPETSASDALERAELGRELARLVIELDEPFRSVLLLRYSDGLSVARIAETLEVPVKTVESRLRRGHERLRERFGHGRENDLSALCLIAGIESPAAHTATAVSVPSWIGALIVNTKVAALLCALVGGGLVWVAFALAQSGDQPPLAQYESNAAGVGEPIESESEPEELVRTVPGETAERALIEDAVPALPVEAATTPTEPRRVSGRVLDSEGRALSGIDVAFRVNGEVRAQARSSAGGRFELDAPRTAGRVSTADPAFEDLFVQHAEAHSRSELLLVVAPHRSLAGIVRDETGQPVQGAKVGLDLPRGFTARFDAVIDAAVGSEWRVLTDSNGRFELDRVPVVEGSALAARLDGYEPSLQQPPLGPSNNLEFVLTRPQEDTLAGRVTLSDGQPAHGALVSLGVQAARTAPDGTFRLSIEGARDSSQLTAVMRGALPVRFQAEPHPNSGEPQWPEWIELTLGGSPLSLSGRVVDTEGNPRADLRVWIDDPTEFGQIGEDLWVQLENVAAPLDSSYDDSCDEYFYWTRTDAEGRFLLQGLLDREYRIGVLHPDTARTIHTEPFQAGRSDLEIELSTLERRQVRGRIRSQRGTPLEGLRVALHCPMFGGVHHKQGEALTDADGRFSFDGIAGEDLSVWIRGESVVPSIQQLSWSGDEEGELVVEGLCHLKVDCELQPDLADHVSVVDAEGNDLLMRDISATGVLAKSRWSLVEGRTITIGVSENAAELLLFKDGAETRRIALQLKPGSLNVIRP